MISWTVLAGVALLALGLGLAIYRSSADSRVPVLTLEIMAGVVRKLGTFRFRDAYRLAWLTWRLHRMDEMQLVHVLAAVETRQMRTSARWSRTG
jgi:hypothetical protein